MNPPIRAIAAIITIIVMVFLIDCLYK